mmetsp:Transcript_26611/g.63064  ORF Transcript_26611/g.63064 Transcript_26611/m.63064 type:complete len:153 (+) Transcript_26611:165-623(+)
MKSFMGKMGSALKKKSKSASLGSQDLAVDTPSSAGYSPYQTGTIPRSSSFTLAESSDHKSWRRSGIFGRGRKSADNKTLQAEVERLQRELELKEEEASRLRDRQNQTEMEVEQWKERCNMHQLKLEVLIDMWSLRIVNGDGKLREVFELDDI